MHVAPYVGAWIETDIGFRAIWESTSHPTWVRGLKHSSRSIELLRHVAPYVGAWIETNDLLTKIENYAVAPYVGAWIETFYI